MVFLALSASLLTTLLSGRPAQSAAPPVIADIRYELTFNRATAARREVHVAMRFRANDDRPIALSLPAWTPGSYELGNFARWVLDFRAASDDRALEWDKIDFDTWRVRPAGARSITVSFSLRADTLDNGIAWSAEDFLLLNGTAAFLYPEGSDLGFSASVVVHTEPDWKVATGMTSGGALHRFAASDYHELVDMPFFVGAMDVDSTAIDGHWYRLASYPAGAMTGEGRDAWWRQLGQMVPALVDVYRDIPWETYTTLLIFDAGFPGGAALEHANSHVGIYHPAFIGNPILASITAHEIIHAWNVKRLRPAELVPYDYSRPQPTTLLWVSEGLTDYYADLALIRGGIVPPLLFGRFVADKVNQVMAAPPVALEDASLNTWISPIEVDQYIYYPKGSLVGLLLDILIRDASDNRAGLDDVMRSLYEQTYKAGRGFTTEDFWAAASAAADGRDFTAFAARYVDGRDPLPWAETLPLAGLIFQADTARIAVIGISSSPDEHGIRVIDVLPGGMADSAGVTPGDYLVQVGELLVTGNDFDIRFRNRYANSLPGTPLKLAVRRGEAVIPLEGPLTFSSVVTYNVQTDRGAGPKAQRIRDGILRGVTGN